MCAVQGLLVSRAEDRPWSIGFISINASSGIQWIMLCSKLRIDSGRFLLSFRNTAAVFMAQPFHPLCFSLWLFLFTPCAWIYHRQLDKAVTLQMLVVQVIKCHAQSILKSRREHQNEFQLYKIIIKKYGDSHLTIIKKNVQWSVPYVVISKIFLRITYLVLSGFSIYSLWMEEKHWRAECGYYLSNLPFKRHPTPKFSCSMAGWGQQRGSGKRETPSKSQIKGMQPCDTVQPVWRQSECLESTTRTCQCSQLALHGL